MANNLTEAQVWARDLLFEAEKILSLKKYEGKQGSRSLVVRYDDLTKTAGDKINITIARALSGAGVTGNSVLEGNEEDIAQATFQLAIDYLRNGVKFTKKEQQMNPYDLLNTGKLQLATWLAEKIEAMAFANISNGNDVVIYGGDATSIDTIDSADVMNTAIISRAKAKIKSARDCYPITIGGKKYYVMFIDGFQAYNLKQDTAFINAQRDAQVRGNDNPIFTGALGIWDGVIIEENELLVSGTNTGSVRYTKSLICGADAIAMGYGQLPSFNVQKKDYGFTTGVATDANFGVQPVRFDNKDHAIVSVITAAEDPNA